MEAQIFQDRERSKNLRGAVRDRTSQPGQKEGMNFPTELRVAAQQADDRLRPYGKQISDAVDFYINHLEATTRSAPARGGDA